MKPILNHLDGEFEKLPVYWKLATFRCCLYSIVSLLTTVASGLGAYKFWHEITWIGRFLIASAGVVSMLNTIVAFLDTTMQKIAPNTETTTVIANTTTTIPAPEQPETPPAIPPK